LAPNSRLPKVRFFLPSSPRRGNNGAEETIVTEYSYGNCGETRKKFWKAGWRGLVKNKIMDYFIYELGG
jgi:hypothetical protein